MPFEQIETLLQKYYNGETSLEEEETLQTFFRETQLLPDALKIHAVQFQAYGQEQEQHLDKFLADDWLFEKIEQPIMAASSSPQPNRAKSWSPSLWQMAAGITLLLVAFWTGNQFRQQNAVNSGTPELVALQQEVREMKQVLTTTAAAPSSASDRIRVVSQEFNTDDFTDNETQEVTNLLIKTMTTDENVNVRLAACEALYQFKAAPHVRKAYIQALGQEKNPLMQLALIEVVTHLKEKKAVPQLQKLANQENLLPIVKLKAQEGLGTLI